MTANPLKSGGDFAPNSFAGMELGETRTVVFRDGRSKTITRTEREFIYDWVDATNAEIPPERGLKWVIDGMGNPQLVNSKFRRNRGNA